MALDFIRKNLFTLTVGGDSFAIEVQSVSGPSESSDVVEIPYNNKVFKFPGIARADDMTVTFRCTDNRAYQIFKDWREQSKDVSPGASLRDVRITSADGRIDNTIPDAFCSSLTGGDWDSSDGGPLTFEATITGSADKL